MVFALLAGCGYSGRSGASSAVALSGSVHGGRQPVSGASIQLYAVGTEGDGSVAFPMLSGAVRTDGSGNFSIPASYGCPSASSPVYVVASGGSPGPSAGNNPGLVLIAVLGPCGKLSGSTPVSVNEVTTVGSVFPLVGYMADARHLGSASGDAAFLTAVATVAEFMNFAQGSAPGTATSTSYFGESAKLDSLANALADCVNSSGGTAGDGSPCGQLFAAATPPGGSAPSDTVTAALRIAQNPKRNVANIYGLALANPPFEPALTTAPADWALTLSYAVAAPDISLPSGAYSGTQEVTLSDATAGSTLYYTTDGTVPSSSSQSYAGPIAVSVTTTLQAIAVLQGSQSAVASSTLTITAANPPERLAFLDQPSNTSAGATMTPAVRVMVEDINGNVVPAAADAVKLTLVGGSGLQGTLTVTPQNGIATFNDLSVSAPGSGYTLLATSPNLPPAVSTPFVITPPVGGSPVKLAFLQQPSNALTQATITPAVTVVVEDGNGNPVTNSTNPVTLALTGVAGLTGTVTATPQNGIATFSNLSVATAGTYTLTATSPSLTPAASASFVITAPGGGTPPPPVKLAFLQQPTNALTGSTIAPAVTVVVEDSNGNTVPSAVNPVTLTLVGGTGLGGTLSAIPKNGIATFNNLSVSNAGTYTLVAISTSLLPAISKGFTITSSAPVPAKLAFLQQPSNASAGTTMAPPVTVAIEDSNGNTETAASNPVTLSLTIGTGLAGTLTVTPQNGVATFSNLSVSNAGSYTLEATTPGLTAATSTVFTISAVGPPPPPAAKLAFLQQPSNASTGATITPPVTVVVEDSSGNAVTGGLHLVTIALTTGSGLAGTLTATPQNGVATFNNLSETTAGTYTFLATSPGLTAATSSSFTISVPSNTGASYYISPSGSDSNSGTSPSSPWLTPNHALTCGDVISAAPGNYSAANFGPGHWGTVSCPAANNVAWLQCATFDTCKITATSSDAMWVDKSFWGVQGWENSTHTTSVGACFHAGPTSGGIIHHVIFANNVANGCMGGGFNAYDLSTSASVDYITYIGNVAYNTAQGSGACYSGFNVYQPIASDSASGTHNYAAGNFAYHNVDGDPCAGTAPTDGEGINFDTWDFDQGRGTAYTQQGAMENNISVFNGGRGIYVENSNAGGSHAAIYMQGNTVYGNNLQATQAYCSGNGDLAVYNASDITAENNLVQTNGATMCNSAQPKYAISISTANASVVINNNYASGTSGNNTFSYASGSFAFGSGNVIGISPSFANPVDPGAPSCGGSANVPACMATLIANFTPTNAAAKNFGYQRPSATNAYDPLYPQWLCSVNLPAGLVTKGCN